MNVLRGGASRDVCFENYTSTGASTHTPLHINPTRKKIEPNFSQWATSPLFVGLDTAQRTVLLQDLSAGQKEYDKGQTILRTGQWVTALGFVLRGGANVVRRDAWSNKNVLAHMGPGQMFAEAHACVLDATLLVGMTAAGPIFVLFLEPDRLWREAMLANEPHPQFLHNLLQATTAKNLVMTQKIGHITPHTIRERLLPHLSAEAVRPGRMRSTSRSIGSSWRIICAWNAVHCPAN